MDFGTALGSPVFETMAGFSAVRAPRLSRQRNGPDPPAISLRTSATKVVFNFGLGETLKENKPGSRGGGRLKRTGHDHANRTAPHNFGPVTLRTD